MGLIIGMATGLTQYFLTHGIVNRITNSRNNSHIAAVLFAGKLVLWAAVLTGVAFISMDQMLWAAGTMVCTSFGLAVREYFLAKKA